MKRYLFNFLLAYLASFLMFVIMLLIAIGFWLFTDSPMWFNVLWVIIVLLPMLGLGEVFGHRPKAKAVQKTWPALTIIIAIMVILAFLGELSDGLQLLSWPGLLLGGALKEFLSPGSYWDGLFIILGNIILPLLFHLGWYWGRTAE